MNLNCLIATARTILADNPTIENSDAVLHAVASWLLVAGSVTEDDGQAAFFHCAHNQWAPSYPEVTGYTIPTLLAYARRHSRPDACVRAIEMAQYMLRVQTAQGAIPSWRKGAPVYVFDTGQVLQGWLAAWEETHGDCYVDALRRAADWLIAQQVEDGTWPVHQYGGHVKVWDVRTAWPLLQVGCRLELPSYVDAGRRCLEWALTQQHADGWLDRCEMAPGEPAVLHAIAYAVEGLLEGGLLVGDERYILASRRTADALLTRLDADGRLGGYWRPGWRVAERSVCLTGNAQIALCWLRLYELTQRAEYAEGARRALRLVCSKIRLDEAYSPFRGGVPGSWPIWGRYMRWSFPSWAAKFTLDALMRCEALGVALDG